MNVRTSGRLFWFLKEGSSLDLAHPSQRQMYFQQVLTHGREEDIRSLLRSINPPQFKETFERVKHFLPSDVRNFWEDFLAGS